MKPLILLAGAFALPLLAVASGAAEPPKMDEASSMSYALGYQVGRDLSGTEVRSEALMQGLKDGQAGTAARLGPEEMQAALTSLVSNARCLSEGVDVPSLDGVAFIDRAAARWTSFKPWVAPYA